MRNCLWIGLVLATIGCQQKTPSAADKYGDGAADGAGHHSRSYVETKTSPDFRQRADSLAALDPVQEANAAARRGDLKYLAVCGMSCTPIGGTGDTVCFLNGCDATRRDDVHPIEGMDVVPPFNADVARLDSIGTRYGTRYNDIIREFRKHRRAPHPIA